MGEGVLLLYDTRTRLLPLQARQRQPPLKNTCLFIARPKYWHSPDASKIIKSKLAVHVRYLLRGHSSEEKWTEEPGEPSKHGSGFPQIRKWKGRGEEGRRQRGGHWNMRLTELMKPLEGSLTQSSFRGAKSPIYELALWLLQSSLSHWLLAYMGNEALVWRQDTVMDFRAQHPGPISQWHSFICNLTKLSHGAYTSIFILCRLNCMKYQCIVRKLPKWNPDLRSESLVLSECSFGHPPRTRSVCCGQTDDQMDIVHRVSSRQSCLSILRYRKYKWVCLL